MQLNAERGAKVIDEVINLIRGTHLDTGAYLDRIKNLTPNDQLTAAKRDRAPIRQNDDTIARVADVAGRNGRKSMIFRPV